MELQTLYHYSSYNTLLTILKNRTFRLTSIELMNDFSEVSYGIQLLYDLLKEKGFSLCQKPFFRESIDANARNLFLEKDYIDTFRGPYIMCFSTKNDGNIPMWKMYGDDFKGVSIGFNFNKVPMIYNSLLKRNNDKHISENLKSFVPCNHVSYDYRIGLSNIIYSKQEVDQVLLRAYGIFESLHPKDTNTRMQAASIALAPLMSFIKSEYFKYEEEYRLAYIDPMPPGGEHQKEKGVQKIYYLKDNCIVRGYELEWGTANPIESITLGPNFKGSIDELRKYLNLLGYPEIEIIKSGIPIR